VVGKDRLTWFICKEDVHLVVHCMKVDVTGPMAHLTKTWIDGMKENVKCLCVP